MDQTPDNFLGTAALPIKDVQSNRLIWKLKGTSKKTRRAVIEQCAEGQPVFVICNSDGSHCTVITENGAEIGRLSDTASAEYHQLVEKNPHNIYIKHIALDLEKPRIKVVVIIHRDKRVP